MTPQQVSQTRAPFWHGDMSRGIVERIIIEGELVLETPAHFGNGDAPDQTTIPLLVDAHDGASPLLTGASIAGALRSYLWSREAGYRVAESPSSLTEQLFGAIHLDLERDDDPGQSRLIIDDSIGIQKSPIETRDGVSLAGSSQTAKEKALYSHELWAAGTRFPLRFELLLLENDENGDMYAAALVTALEGFSSGEIHLGGRKRRGWGTVRADQWRARRYRLTDPNDLLAWLRESQEPLGKQPGIHVGASAAQALGVESLRGDMRRRATIEAEFSVDSSLLIRSGDGKLITHLHSRRGDADVPILSGTSLTGALRARALMIARTLHDDEKSRQLVDAMFGSDIGHDNRRRSEGMSASKLSVHEVVVAGGRADLEQTRVAIDRFTGGALDTALFREKPLFGGNDALLKMRLQLENPANAEIGLLLFVLRDLWVGDLALGGESSVGRGRLRGRQISITTPDGEWEAHADQSGALIGANLVALEEMYVQAFVGAVL